MQDYEGVAKGNVTTTPKSCPVCVPTADVDDVLCICMQHEGLHEYCTEVCEC